MPTGSGLIKHRNISLNGASFAGEVEFLSPTEVRLNANSGRYGNWSPYGTEAQYMQAIRDCEDLGYNVWYAPGHHDVHELSGGIMKCPR